MKRALLTLLLASSLGAEGLDDYVREQMIVANIPGIAIAVVQEGAVVEMKTYGTASVEHQCAVTPSTRFQLASVTKALTGTALMRLVEEGALSLDDPVSKFIADAPESWKPITIRHLATHTSGLKEAPDLPASLSSAEAVKKIAALPLQWEPGTRAAYGNSDFIVLAHIIERVTGMTFPAFLQRKLLGPLAMTATMFDNASESGRARITAVVPRRSGVYLWSDGVQKTYTFLYPESTYSAGGLFSTIEDVAKWIVAIDRGTLLKPESLNAMWTAAPKSDFAIGWMTGRYRGQRAVGHSGGPALADILRFPDRKLTIIVLQNQRKLYPYLAQGVADFFLGDLPIARTEPIADPNANADLGAELTNQLRVLIDELGRGIVEPSRFHEADLTTIRDYLMPMIRSFGPASSFEWIGPGNYRAIHGRKAILWKFELAPDGRVHSFEVEAE